jgi:potassium channel subfamily K, other eukaryote
LLVKVIKRVIHDHLEDQHMGRQSDYSFEDWEDIFDLIGALGPVQGEEGSSATAEGSLHPSLTHTSLESWKDGKEVMDWLHWRNPLNITETLTEWILLTLVDKLELELSELRQKMGQTSVNDITPSRPS